MAISDSSSRILAGLLEARTGQQLTMSRRWRIETALSGLMRQRKIASIDELITLLVMNRDARLSDEVIEALLNNETYFFRDRAPFDMLQRELLPAVRNARLAERKLAIWSAGCSTGQEAYSIAMMIAEDPLAWAGWEIEIVGTDVSRTVTDRAREGIFTHFEVQRGLGIQQTIRWFEERGDQWAVVDQIRDMVRFEARNLFDAPPRPGQFDLILCRNVLLYFCNAKRRDAFDRMASALKPDGGLLLGAGETVIGQTERFAADRSMRGIYRLAGGRDADRRATGS
ncbi:CheR family methyltransferase [Sphingomicrobium astaxanthinifaciens]|uniref:CheR family methyltransferase n=1 Tax=Sphingomicrobium astaxanthinifaciens TaxID=1227949 RepID=UPI001FCBE069|nr:protein-glutamate O-methyltransferase CheR [Sphingomicrobium astaxanthinifaciens]MCJ7422252.1 protein-glutamate O-methyltransferase CheR [Sphingomicrobium astaxanthinifaciens]